MSSQTNVYPSNIDYLLYFFLLFISLIFSFNAYCSDQWQQVSDGIEYQDLGGGLLAPWSHVHVFRIDLTQNTLALVTAKNLSLNNASADQFAEHSKALLSINGGFFDQNYHPLGLRISNQQQYNQFKQISWWGVFYTKQKKAHITSMLQYKNSYQYSAHIDFAIQSGPRLIIDKHIPNLKSGRAERTAIGINTQNKIIILVTDNAPTSTYTLAQIMRSPPLNCTDALNLDGGNSSQLYAHINSFKSYVHGFSNITDAVIVTSR